MKNRVMQAKHRKARQMTIRQAIENELRWGIAEEPYADSCFTARREQARRGRIAQVRAILAEVGM